MTQEEYRCEVCGARLDSEAGLAQHEREMHPQYTCDICGETFNSQDEWEAHDQVAHPENKTTL